MFFKLVMLLIGFVMTVSSGVSLVAYLNLLVLGNSFKEYSIFIIGRMEPYIFIIGLSVIYSVIYFSFRKNE